MNRPGDKGGDASSIPDVLGLKHADGSPLTLESCLAWADRKEKEYRERSQEQESFMCNFDGNPVDGELIRGLTRELRTLHAVRLAWLALANVFEAVQHEAR